MLAIPHQDKLTDRSAEQLDSGITVDNAQDGTIRSRRIFDTPIARLQLNWSTLKGDIVDDLMSFWGDNQDRDDLTVSLFGADYIGQIVNRPQRQFRSGVVIGVTASFVGKLA